MNNCLYAYLVESLCGLIVVQMRTVSLCKQCSFSHWVVSVDLLLESYNRLYVDD